MQFELFDGYIRAHELTPFKGGTILVTGYNHQKRNKKGKEPFEVVFNDNTEHRRVKNYKNQAEAESRLRIIIDWRHLRS